MTTDPEGIYHLTELGHGLGPALSHYGPGRSSGPSTTRTGSDHTQ